MAIIIQEAALRKAAVQVSSYDPEFGNPRSAVLAILETILGPSALHEKAAQPLQISVSDQARS